MKTALTTFVAILALGLGLATTAGEWLTDIEAAKALAAKDKKLILLDFTGSDWCGWCIKMKKETFNEKAFKDYAEKNLVLVEVDFPRRHKLPAALAKQNDALMKKYGVEGFPTYVILNAEGRELGRQPEYLKGGPAAFIEKVESIKAKSRNR